ncbi:Hypothetical predicted protein [Mytilus galloprovincialis]|uniref:Fibrinogen C-terminal domain-containing protein n=1 Tax=Mytilus galloprovincialis TaxID=29158 RepID=A0A8B6C443_MYTGA|nr:Hypothetical predicted protein [Mytilus galloprovincialis]
MDCSDLPVESSSDIYVIQPLNSVNVTVFCEMETDGGGWTVSMNSVNITVFCEMETDCEGWTIVQTRYDGSVNFYRNWNDYKKGFGDVTGEHWIGNDNLHNILHQGTYKVRFDLEDFENDTAYAIYDMFNIGNGETNYRLNISGYNGTAGHSVRDSYNISHEGVEFTTYDRDNDLRGDINCADVGYGEAGGWWYGSCTWSNINGLYNVDGHRSIHWDTWRGKKRLRKTKMMIKQN